MIGTVAEYRFWEVGSWQKKHGLPRENAGKSVGWIVFSPDGKMLAVLHSMTEVRLVDPATGREFARLPTAGGPYCFSPDGSQLVTYAGRDGAFQVWDLRLIRRQLKEMDLDWDLPPYPPPPSERREAAARQGAGRRAAPALEGAGCPGLPRAGPPLRAVAAVCHARRPTSTGPAHSTPNGPPGKRWSAPIRRRSSGTPRTPRPITSGPTRTSGWASTPTPSRTGTGRWLWILCRRMNPASAAIARRSLARAGEHAKAVAEANALAEAKDVDGGMLYNLACVCALAATAVRDDAKLQDQYAARAVELLRQAVAKGYKEAAHMKKDKDLDALRDREDFQEAHGRVGDEAGVTRTTAAANTGKRSSVNAKANNEDKNKAAGEALTVK